MAQHSGPKKNSGHCCVSNGINKLDFQDPTFPTGASFSLKMTRDMAVFGPSQGWLWGGFEPCVRPCTGCLHMLDGAS